MDRCCPLQARKAEQSWPKELLLASLDPPSSLLLVFPGDPGPPWLLRSFLGYPVGLPRCAWAPLAAPGPSWLPWASLAALGPPWVALGGCF